MAVCEIEYWLLYFFVTNFTQVTVDNLRQPLNNPSGNKHFSLVTGGCRVVNAWCPKPRVTEALSLDKAHGLWCNAICTDKKHTKKAD